MIRSLLLLLLASPAQATVVQAFTLEDLADRAAVVFAGKVMEVESRWEGRLIITRARVEVTLCFSGACQSTETLRSVGGQVGDLVMAVEGAARYQAGEELLVFAEPVVGQAALRSVGMAQGKYRIGLSSGLRMASRPEVDLAGPRRAQALEESRLPLDTLLRRLEVALRR